MKINQVILKQQPKDGPICDFCSSSDPIWAYPADDCSIEMKFEDRSLISISDGFWAACGECSKLIDGLSKTELRRRSLSLMPNRNLIPLSDVEIDNMLSKIQGMFWEHRYGEKIRIGATG